MLLFFTWLCLCLFVDNYKDIDFFYLTVIKEPQN